MSSSRRDGDWTTVSYRRRPRQVQFSDWSWDGAPAYARRKDRATSTPYGGWTQCTPPIQPVPPVGMVWCAPSWASRNDRFTRTFASVVRQGGPPRGRLVSSRAREDNTQHRTRHTQPGQDNTNNFRQPATPQFRQMTRHLYKLIKLVHHIQNVTPKPDKPDPRMISRMVETLASFINPTAPTPRTLDLILGNAKNWGHNTLLILQEHYKEQLDKALADLPGILQPDWNAAFQVASRWACRDLPHIQQDVLDHAEALVTTCTEQNNDEQTTTTHQPQTNEPQAPITKTTQTTTRKQTDNMTQTPTLKRKKRITKGTMTGSLGDIAFLDETPSVWSPEGRDLLQQRLNKYTKHTTKTNTQACMDTPRQTPRRKIDLTDVEPLPYDSPSDAEANLVALCDLMEQMVEEDKRNEQQETPQQQQPQPETTSQQPSTSGLSFHRLLRSKKHK